MICWKCLCIMVACARTDLDFLGTECVQSWPIGPIGLIWWIILLLVMLGIIKILGLCVCNSAASNDE